MHKVIVGSYGVIEDLEQGNFNCPIWQIIRGLNDLLKSWSQRGKSALVMEGMDGSGKTFHVEVVQELLAKYKYSVRKVTFPKCTDEIGQVLEGSNRESIDVWTQRFLFSVHRWEFTQWLAMRLERGDAVLSQSYSWSGLAYVHFCLEYSISLVWAWVS